MRKVISGNKAEKINISRNIKFNSFLFGLILMIPYLNLVATNAFSIQSPGVFFGAFVLLFYVILSIVYDEFRITKKIPFFVLVIFIIYLISSMTSNNLNVVIKIFIQFFYYGIISMLVASKQVSTRHILKYVIMLSMIGIVDFNVFLESATVGKVIEMGYSYAILPSVCATIIFFIYYRKGQNKLLYFGYIFNLYLLCLVFTRGTRGAGLSIIFLVVLLIVSKYKKELHKTNKWIIWFSMIVIVYVIYDFQNIISYLYQFTNNNGISINLINKTFIKAMKGSALNGRENLYQLAIEGIRCSPIWGHGIGSFDIKYGIYPHNIILQLMYEGGLILTVLILSIIVYGFRWMLNKKTNNLDLSMMITLLSSISIPRLLFSANIWYRESFWLLMGIILTQVPLKGIKKVKK